MVDARGTSFTDLKCRKMFPPDLRVWPYERRPKRGGWRRDERRCADERVGMCGVGVAWSVSCGGESTGSSQPSRSHSKKALTDNITIIQKSSQYMKSNEWGYIAKCRQSSLRIQREPHSTNIAGLDAAGCQKLVNTLIDLAVKSQWCTMMHCNLIKTSSS